MARDPVQGRNRRGSRNWGRAQLDNRDDPYRPAKKPSEPTVCPQCGAVFRNGRWDWTAAPEDASRTMCEACHRIRENYPAGILTLNGKLLAAHANEIVALARHQEQAEKSRHPLNRIMSIDSSTPGEIIITTTDLHLPRRIARAIEKAFGGHLTERYEEDGDTVRIDWRET